MKNKKHLEMQVGGTKEGHWLIVQSSDILRAMFWTGPFESENNGN
jgi:hypothetical protein